MKTLKNLWGDLTSIDNLELAHQKAKKGKARYKSVQTVNGDERKFLLSLQSQLRSGTYRTSEYDVEVRMCGTKERVLHKLPYFPDRIAHHALLNLVSDFWTKGLIRDTFQSIQGRGTSDCFHRVRKGVQEDKPLFARKLDIVKFYPNLTHDITQNPRLYRISDVKVLDFLFEIISSLPFIPLGNHPSQFIGNLSVSPLDWHCKQDLRIKHYYRYCDDIVIMGNSTQELEFWSDYIQDWLRDIGLDSRVSQPINLDTNYLDFVGFRVNHHKVLLRKTLASNFKKAVKARNLPSLSAYYGWCKSANALNLYHSNVRKILPCHNTV